MKRENRKLKILALVLGILLSITAFISVSQGSRLAAFENTKELLFSINPDEIASNYESLSKRNLNLSDYVALNGFRGIPVKLMTNETPGFEEWDTKYPNASATYSPSMDIINLRDTPKSYTITLKILQHEYGHHLWSKIMTDSERDGYREIYAESSEFIRPYTLKNVKEDFADSYAYYKLELPLPEARREFMEKLEDKYEDF